MRTTGVTRRIVSIVSASALALGTVAVAAGAATAQEPDDSATVTAAAGGIKVKWDWTMPTFMKDTKTFVPTQDVNDPDFWSGGSYVAGPDGITDAKMKQASWYKKSGNALYGKVPKNGRFKVALDASGSSGGSGKLTCAWRIEADKTYKKRSNCSSSTSIMLPEGRHPLWLTVTDADGHSKTVAYRIKVQNTLVVIVGDSYASGEGIPPFTNPDLRSDPNKRQVAWDYGMQPEQVGWFRPGGSGHRECRCPFECDPCRRRLRWGRGPQGLALQRAGQLPDRRHPVPAAAHPL